MNLPYEYRNIPWKESLAGVGGQVLVNWEQISEPRLDVYNYEGSDLSAYHIYAVLKLALSEGWLNTLEELHQKRKSEWKAEIFLSPEGVKEYRLCTNGRNEPVCSSVIAVSGSRIHTFSILPEDAAPLLKKVIEDYPPLLLPRRCHLHRGQDTDHIHDRSSFYYLEAPTMKFLKLPEPLKKQRERTQRIMIDKDILSYGTFQAGERSGLLETIEAIKCLEVLQA